MPTDLHAAVAERVEQAAQRYTTGRRALIDVLDSAGRPLTLSEILESGDWPQSSVYRNLAVLEQAEVVRRVLTHGDFARYELSEDLTGHHHHLICSSCGSVQDFILSPEIEAGIQKAASRAARSSNFTTEGHRLDLTGLCGDCAR